jgi:hypothetical protein
MDSSPAVPGAFFSLCRQMLVRFTNPDLCALTEQVIFSDPYAQAAMNRWTSPQLDEAAAGLRADTEAKAAISVLKRKFCSSADALIHGDLHTGSIMVSNACRQDKFVRGMAQQNFFVMTQTSAKLWPVRTVFVQLIVCVSVMCCLSLAVVLWVAAALAGSCCVIECEHQFWCTSGLLGHIQ